MWGGFLFSEPYGCYDYSMKRTFLMLSVCLLAASCAGPFSSDPKPTKPVRPSSPAPPTATQAVTPQPANGSPIPLDRAGERITKKPFGIFIDKKTSPVQPERFSGYHTGTDYEAFPEEAAADVAVRAICSGTVLLARTVSGYGGVLVQSCERDGQAVTVLYGHLRLSSINLKIGDAISRGDAVGILGTGYSSETAGERKHLHLAVHAGSSVVLAGYVQQKSQLSGWLDAAQVIGELR